MLIKTSKTSKWTGDKKDYLHKRRKELAEVVKPGRIYDYDQWKKANEKNIQEWCEINREFKENGEEGRPQSLDSVRNSLQTGKYIKYE
jgi:hypothetical protein